MAGKVILSEGDFNLSAAVDIITGLTLEGQGKYYSKLKVGSNNIHVITTSHTSHQYITIRDLYMYGRGYAYNYDGIHGDAIDHCIIDNVWAQECRNAYLINLVTEGAGAHQNEIKDCVGYNVKYGIHYTSDIPGTASPNGNRSFNNWFVCGSAGSPIANSVGIWKEYGGYLLSAGDRVDYAATGILLAGSDWWGTILNPYLQGCTSHITQTGGGAGLIISPTYDGTESISLVDGSSNLTKQIFLPVHNGFVGAGTAKYWGGGQTSVEGAANSDEPTVYWTLKLPTDFFAFSRSNGCSVRAVWSSNVAATKNMYWTLSATYGASGERCYAHSDAGGVGVTACGGAELQNIQEGATPLTLTSLARGDILNITFTRTGSNALDTLDAVMELVGILFTYEAVS